MNAMFVQTAAVLFASGVGLGFAIRYTSDLMARLKHKPWQP